MAENALKSVNNRRSSLIGTMVFILCLIQPLLDVLSYWLDEIYNDNTVTLAIRFFIFFAILVVAVVISDRKKIYISVIAAAVLLFAAHTVCCRSEWGLQYNLSWAFSDLANFIRILQYPIFTLAFITFFKKSHSLYSDIENGYFLNFIVIVLVEIISTITGTDPHTYPNKQLGILGWFYFANSQSAILCAIIPVILISCINKNKCCFSLTTVLSMAVLFLFGTRLSYLGIFVICFGLIIVIIFNRKTEKNAIWAILVLLICACVCGIAYKQAPFYINQSRHQEILAKEQKDVDLLYSIGKQEYGASSDYALVPVYDKYLEGLVDKFGIKDVAEEYGRSTNASQIIDVRRLKLNYCKMLMSQSSSGIKIFGLPLNSLSFEDYIYDVENDWHGVYYLFGLAGLLAVLIFTCYFLLIILVALVKDFKKYFTLRAGAVGISLILLLAHIYFTAGVLRRPNASFYVSTALAMSYFLVKLRREDVPDE